MAYTTQGIIDLLNQQADVIRESAGVLDGFVNGDENSSQEVSGGLLPSLLAIYKNIRELAEQIASEVGGADVEQFKAVTGFGAIGYATNVDVLRANSAAAGTKVLLLRHSGNIPVESGGEFIGEANSTAADNGGTILRVNSNFIWRRVADRLLPIHFGAVNGSASTDDASDALQRYIDAVGRGTLDFTKVGGASSGSWRLKKTITIMNATTVITDNSCPFYVDPTTFVGDYAICFGDPSQPNNAGRVGSLMHHGTLRVVCNNRNGTLHGIYVKCALSKFSHLRAEGFPGMGIYHDSVWDSTFERCSVELCGRSENPTPQVRQNFAFVVDSAGDTSNASHYASIQIEQAYDHGIWIKNVVRNEFHNIHAERMYITLDNTTNTTETYNHVIVVGNSILGQAVIDARPSTITTNGVAVQQYAPDGTTPLLNGQPRIRIGLDRATQTTWNAPGCYVTATFGSNSVMKQIKAESLFIPAPARGWTVIEPECPTNIQAELNCTIIDPTTDKFTISTNATNVEVIGGTIQNLDGARAIKGGVRFNNTTFVNPIGVVWGPTGRAANSAVNETLPPTTFNNCVIPTFNGNGSTHCIVNGGYVGTASLASYAAVEFYNVKMDSFTYTGNAAFLTRDCQIRTVTAWATPAYLYPAGTRTSRPGAPTAGQGIDYICTSSTAATWVALTSMPAA